MKYAFHDHAWEMGVKTLNGNCVLAQMKQFEEGFINAIGADNRMAPLFHIFSRDGRCRRRWLWPVMPVAARYSDEVYRAQDFAVRGERTAQALSTKRRGSRRTSWTRRSGRLSGCTRGRLPRQSPPSVPAWPRRPARHAADGTASAG